MATGGTPEDSGQHEADNVIRFPRDWFGSRDDLIPIGSAADRLEEEAAAAERERDHALSADDFWGEGSGALHQPVDLPRSDDTAAPASAGDRDAVVRSLPIRPVPRRRGSLPRVSLPHVSRTPRLRAPRSVLVLAALVIAALALFVSGEFRTTARPARSASRQAASPVTTPQALFSQSAQAKLIAASESAFRSATKPYLVEPPRTHTVKHVVKRSRRTTREVHRTTGSARTESAVAKAPAAPAPAESTDVAASNDVTPVSSSSAADSTPVQSGESSSSASASSSSSAASGPSGLGAAVGPQCNPQCSR